MPADRSVFGSLEFVRVIAGFRGWEGGLFVVGDEHGSLAYPFLMRRISDLPFAPNSDLWDAASPDYTGPVADGHVSDSMSKMFLEGFEAYCRENRIVSEFAHLHPWLATKTALEPGSIEFNRELVYVDATVSDEELWTKHFGYACRKNINRAKREGVRILQATTEQEIQRFFEIYTDLMRRRNASAGYYFPLEFFTKIFNDLPGNARFSLAEYQGRIVGGILYLYDNDCVYSYLGGADHDSEYLRPTNAIVYDTIQWAKQTGRKHIVLGAGHRPNDGIERFKATFSPLRVPFYTYRRIHQPSLYEALCCQARIESTDRSSSSWSYFPAYRSPKLTGASRAAGG